MNRQLIVVQDGCPTCRQKAKDKKKINETKMQ